MKKSIIFLLLLTETYLQAQSPKYLYWQTYESNSTYKFWRKDISNDLNQPIAQVNLPFSFITDWAIGDSLYFSNYEIAKTDLNGNNVQRFAQIHVSGSYQGLHLDKKLKKICTELEEFNHFRIACFSLDKSPSNIYPTIIYPKNYRPNWTNYDFYNPITDGKTDDIYYIVTPHSPNPQPAALYKEDALGNMQKLMDVPEGFVGPVIYFNHLNQKHIAYWFSRHNIYQSKLDGTNFTPVIDNLSTLSTVSLDVKDNKLYWLDATKIYRANLDGTQIEVLVDGLSNPSLLRLSFENNYITPTAHEEVPSNKISLEAFPNPFQDHLQISYTLPQATTVSLTVYDVLGRPVTSILSEQVQVAGQQKVEWKPPNLPNGVYFWRFSTNRGEIQTGKWIKNS